MTEPTTTGAVGWLIGALIPLFGGAAWVGRIQSKVNRNTADIQKLTDLSERMVKVETNVTHIAKWVNSQ